MRTYKVTQTGSGTTSPYFHDPLVTPFNVGLFAVVSGTSSVYTIQFSPEPIGTYSSTATYSSSAPWFNYSGANFASGATSSVGNYAFPVWATRMVVSATSTNAVTLYITQGLSAR